MDNFKYNIDYNTEWLPQYPDDTDGRYKPETVQQALQLLRDAKIHGDIFYISQRENIYRAIDITSKHAAFLMMQKIEREIKI